MNREKNLVYTIMIDGQQEYVTILRSEDLHYIGIVGDKSYVIYPTDLVDNILNSHGINDTVIVRSQNLFKYGTIMAILPGSTYNIMVDDYTLEIDDKNIFKDHNIYSLYTTSSSDPDSVPDPESDSDLEDTDSQTDSAPISDPHQECLDYIKISVILTKVINIFISNKNKLDEFIDNLSSHVEVIKLNLKKYQRPVSNKWVDETQHVSSVFDLTDNNNNTVISDLEKNRRMFPYISRHNYFNSHPNLNYGQHKDDATDQTSVNPDFVYAGIGGYKIKSKDSLRKLRLQPIDWIIDPNHTNLDRINIQKTNTNYVNCSPRTEIGFDRLICYALNNTYAFRDLYADYLFDNETDQSRNTIKTVLEKSLHEINELKLFKDKDLFNIAFRQTCPSSSRIDFTDIDNSYTRLNIGSLHQYILDLSIILKNLTYYVKDSLNKESVIKKLDQIFREAIENESDMITEIQLFGDHKVGKYDRHVFLKKKLENTFKESFNTSKYNIYEYITKTIANLFSYNLDLDMYYLKLEENGILETSGTFIPEVDQPGRTTLRFSRRNMIVETDGILQMLDVSTLHYPTFEDKAKIKLFSFIGDQIVKNDIHAILYEYINEPDITNRHKLIVGFIEKCIKAITTEDIDLHELQSKIEEKIKTTISKEMGFGQLKNEFDVIFEDYKDVLKELNMDFHEKDLNTINIDDDDGDAESNLNILPPYPSLKNRFDYIKYTDTDEDSDTNEYFKEIPNISSYDKHPKLSDDGIDLFRYIGILNDLDGESEDHDDIYEEDDQSDKSGISTTHKIKKIIYTIYLNCILYKEFKHNNNPIFKKDNNNTKYYYNLAQQLVNEFVKSKSDKSDKSDILDQLTILTKKYNWDDDVEIDDIKYMRIEYLRIANICENIIKCYNSTINLNRLNRINILNQIEQIIPHAIVTDMTVTYEKLNKIEKLFEIMKKQPISDDNTYEIINNVGIYSSEIGVFEINKKIKINPKIIECLIKRKCNLNALDNFGNFPITYAISNLATDLIDKLVNKYHTQILKKNNSNISPYIYYLSEFIKWCEILEEKKKYSDRNSDILLCYSNIIQHHISLIDIEDSKNMITVFKLLISNYLGSLNEYIYKNILSEGTNIEGLDAHLQVIVTDGLAKLIKNSSGNITLQIFENYNIDIHFFDIIPWENSKLYHCNLNTILLHCLRYFNSETNLDTLKKIFINIKNILCIMKKLLEYKPYNEIIHHKPIHQNKNLYDSSNRYIYIGIQQFFITEIYNLYEYYLSQPNKLIIPKTNNQGDITRNVDQLDFEERFSIVLQQFIQHCIQVFFIEGLSLDDIEEQSNKLEVSFDTVEQSIINNIKKYAEHKKNIILNDNDGLINHLNEELFPKYKKILHLFFSHLLQIYGHYVNYINNQIKFLDIGIIFLNRIEKIKDPNSS